MAPTYGSAKGSGTSFRVGIELTVPTPGVLDTSVTVTTKVYVWTKDKVTDPSVSLTLSGNAVTAATHTVAVNTVSNSDWSSSNKVLVRTETKSIATSNLDQALTATASVTGINAANAATVATVTVKGTLKKSPVTAPDAPTALVASYASGPINLTWTNTNPNSTTKPYLNVMVERWDNVKAAWYKIATLGKVTSFTDTTTAVDRKYQYRISASNGGGTSGVATSAQVQTVPAVPLAPEARRPAVNVEVSWTVNSTIATQYKLWHAENGVLDAAALATLPVATTTYTHVGASTSASHTYYLQAVGASLSSAMSGGSLPVLPASPPLSPSNLSPSGGILDAAAPIALTWDANSVDGTGQVGFKPKWREQGTEVWSLPDGLTLSASGNATTNEITCAGHMLNEGDIVRFTGAPPAPLAAGTQYFAIPASATLLRVASTEDNAEDGIAIDLTTAGGSFSVQTGRIISNVSTYTIAGGTFAAGKAWEWTVSTDGRYTGINPSSPFTPVGGFRTATKPTLTISYPESGDIIGSPQAMVAWVFYTPDLGVTQQWAEVSLWQGTTLLEMYESAGDWSSFTFETTLVNGAEYRVEVQAEGSNGVRSDIYSSTFTTEYVGPVAANIALEWDSEDGLVIIEIGNPDDLDAPSAANNTLYRSVGGSGWELVKSGLTTNTTVIDYLPTPNKVNSYRVVTKAADGSAQASEASVLCSNTGDWYWLNGGDAFDMIAKVRYEAGVTVRFEVEKVLHSFAGRTLPVEFTGTLRTHTIELSALLPRDAEGYAVISDLEALYQQLGPVYYRDPVGRRIRCSLGEIELDDSENLIEFSTTLTEVDS